MNRRRSTNWHRTQLVDWNQGVFSSPSREHVDKPLPFRYETKPMAILSKIINAVFCAISLSDAFAAAMQMALIVLFTEM